MRNFVVALLAILCFASFVACDSDSDSGSTEGQLSIGQLLGEWVYDHPEEGVWEMQKFMPSGVFYYSNASLGGWKFSNDTKDGRYTVEDGNRVTMNVVMGGVQMRLMLKVLSISDYSYTAEYTNGGASVGVFTYAKLLGSVMLKPGESHTPDYSQIVSAPINGFGSHDTDVVRVDAGSGTVTAVSAGHTYVDIMTDEGTAVYEITVFDYDDMFEDYSFAFGKTIPEIVEVKGSDYIWRDDKNGLIYHSDDFLTDTVTYITGVYDNTHVEYVLLNLNDNVASSRIRDFLGGKYELLSSDNGLHSYVTDMEAGGKPVAVMYDENRSTLVFTMIRPADRWADFTHLFGQSDGDVNREMTERQYQYLFSDYSYSKDGSDYYSINDSQDAYLAGFVFNSDKAMCEYWIYLNDDFMDRAEDILFWLNSKYVLDTSESNASQYVFYDSGNQLKVVFSASGYVAYTAMGLKPFTPATAGVKAPGITKSQVSELLSKSRQARR